MERVIDNYGAYLFAIIIIVAVPIIITCFQVYDSTLSYSLLCKYTAFTVILTVAFYLCLFSVPLFSTRFHGTKLLPFEWFMLMAMLYLLWGTLYFALGYIIGSYIVLFVLLALSFIPMHTIFTKVHHGFGLLYLIAFFWILYVFVIQTIDIANKKF